ncbi:MAG: LytS/YhcK type 5TM receptor domain-containing protein [Syntrophomonas sp.]|nr:LytS/YhcK type 5TM receptor domain-containing protein [Syntrophomonas sp.]
MDHIIDVIITLIKNMSVIIVLAYVLTRTKTYSDILQNKFNWKNRLGLILVFGLFSIYGTLSGMEIMGSIANFRDLGPAIAGLVGGPVVGMGAGLIGAAHRYSMGGITSLACSLSTIIAGLAGGVVYKYRKGEFIIVGGAVIFAVVVECMHMGLCLLISRPYDQVLEIVKQVSLPMILSNALGLGIFAFIVCNLVNERNTESVKKLIESELKIAREIQMGIVPKIFPAFPERSEFDIYAVLEPAKEVGGDLYDFFLLDDDLLCFTIGDVSGKGVPASLFMAVTKTLIKAKADRLMTPAEILAKVNDDLCEDNESCMFVTEFLGILHIPSGEVVYSNAGHNLPYLVRRDGSIEPLAKTTGMALGVMEGIPFEKSSFNFECGDTLLMYTDGVTEAMNSQGELFMEQRLEEILAGFGDKSVKEETAMVLNAVKEYAGEALQSDDITIVALKYKLAG